MRGEVISVLSLEGRYHKCHSERDKTDITSYLNIQGLILITNAGIPL